MSEEEIKRRMMEQLQQHGQAEALQQHMQQKQEEAIKHIMRNILTPKARERLANLRSVKPDVATGLEMYLAQLYQSGQIRGKITESQLIEILKKINEKQEFKIRRK